MGKNKNASILIPIDRKQSDPLYRQIVSAVRNLIHEGALNPGQTLPSSRKLAEMLGVNRTTVNRAYEELQAIGYLASSPGSYHRVRQRRQEAAYRKDRMCPVSWNDAATEFSRKIHGTYLRYFPEEPKCAQIPDDTINISRLDLDPRLFPVKELKRCTDNVLFYSGAGALQYGDHKGYAALRQIIARRLRLHGISVSEEEILLTNGAQQGLDLVCRVFMRPEAKVAIESPTYANILPLLRFSGADTIAIPMKEDGMDLQSLENAFAREKVSFVYTIPNFQNPTGITTPHEHRENLLSICLKHKVPIVEDGFEEDMKYYGKVPMPIKSIDEANIVVYLGTFSKALFPGLRIGWVTADKECISRLCAVKRFTDLTSSLFVQMIMHEFIDKGYYDRQLRKLHRIFRKRMRTALSEIERRFPPSASWTKPAGGYTIWVRLPQKMGEDRLQEAMMRHGVIVSPGNYYFLGKKTSEYFRISISRLDENEIKEGIKRAGAALKEMAKGA